MYHPESVCGESVSPPHQSVSPPESVYVRESTSLPHESVSPPKIPKGVEQTGNILQHSSVLSQLLTQRAPEVKYPQSKPKYSARLLTSSENLMLLEEKERK